MGFGRGPPWFRLSIGGEDEGPVPDRTVLVELPTAVSTDALCTLTTGRFTGDICRCLGGPTLILRGAAGQVLASASLHGHGRLGWDRARLRNDLVVADAAGLNLVLAGHDVLGQLGSFLGPLADRLDLHEREPQFRPAGEAGRPYLVECGVPEVLHPVLVAVTDQQAAELSAAQLDVLRRALAAAIPAPVDRATALLSWLGRMTIPAEALWGDGALVRQLLADLSRTDLATAAGPTLRHLFPPATATSTRQ